MASGWVFGINSTDEHTGSAHSAAAVEFTVGNENLFIDPIQGPIMNDRTKRLAKQQAVREIEKELQKITEPTLLIAGWWYAMLEVDKLDCHWENEAVELRYLPPPDDLEAWKNRGYTLRYLPEQADIVDRKFDTNYVAQNATLLPIP